MAIDFWPIYLVKILKKHEILYTEKTMFLTFWVQYQDWGEMSSIPFYRASETLSIGIWLDLNSGKVWRKKSSKWVRSNIKYK